MTLEAPLIALTLSVKIVFPLGKHKNISSFFCENVQSDCTYLSCLALLVCTYLQQSVFIFLALQTK